MARETSRRRTPGAVPAQCHLHAMACPSRSLKPAIDCFALVTTVFLAGDQLEVALGALDEGLLLVAGRRRS